MSLERARALVGREAQLREAARLVELVPGRQAQAQWLFRRASGLRRARLALLVRAGVLESAEPWTR